MQAVQKMPVSGVVEALWAEEQQQVVTSAAGEDAAPENQSGETTPDSATGEHETTTDGAEQKQRDGKLQRRMNKLTREKSVAEQEAAFWRERALMGGAKQDSHEKPETKPTATSASTEPKPDDFETQAEYLRALTKFELAEQRRQEAAERQQTEQKTQQETKVNTFKGRETAFAEATTDYMTVIQEAIEDGVAMSPALWEEVQDHEHGPALLYHLAKNPDEAARLSAMTPTQVAREVARLESRFVPKANAEETPVETPSQPVTQAPKPPTPAAKSGGGAVQ
ncbi:MAG: hypothetical protein V4734_07210, partial [Terriglobus sp.]